MTTYVSSGGFGDAWIALLKIRAATAITRSMHNWIHCHRRAEHAQSIGELVGLLPNIDFKEARHCPRPGQTQEEVRRLKKDAGAKFINSNARELCHPCPSLSFLARPRPIADDYAIINPEAGKPANWRAITPGILQHLVDELSQSGLKVVLVGKNPNHTKAHKVNGALNLCGQTSVAELINWVYHADSFFAFDGAIAYMAMSMGKPGTILFTHQEKRNGAMHGYMCDQWRSQVDLGVTKNLLSSMKDIKWA